MYNLEKNSKSTLEATVQKNLLTDYQQVRAQTQFLCEPLEIEDFVVQPVEEVSPPKWHLGHTTWFFENFVLVPHCKNYRIFHPKYNFFFNSYYVAAGERWQRTNRGQLTRPTVNEIFAYRTYVDKAMADFIETNESVEELAKIIELGMQHEQQHQELFLYDIKKILGDNPLNPIYRQTVATPEIQDHREWLIVEEDTYSIGYDGENFHFDNEKGVHKVFLHEYQVASGLVTNGEFMEFMSDGGYESFQYWFHEAWDWVNKEGLKSPRYWVMEDAEWWHYTLGGYKKVNLNDPVAHVSYYEADAFARWKNCRLPTEHEWEVACKMYGPTVSSEGNFMEDKYFSPIQSPDHSFLGNLWEWTSSSYGAYPYFKISEGGLGEYNGKFMVNQMVLRGGSYATSRNHIRPTYRNFFHPHLRWLFSGVRLAKHT